MEENKLDNTTIYVLEDVVSKIVEVSGQKSRLDNKFGLEYLIPNVSEDNLTEVGFTFTGYSSYHRCPTYQMGNIFAIYNDQILHVMKTIV